MFKLYRDDITKGHRYRELNRIGIIKIIFRGICKLKEFRKEKSKVKKS